MDYVDGFVLTVPEKNLDAYKKIASAAAQVWKDHGALEYKECVADDVTENEFCQSFTTLAKPKEGEIIVFSYIVFKSREHRDEVNKKVMEDPRLKDMCDPNNSPFDVKRMSYGGFKTIVST